MLKLYIGNKNCSSWSMRPWVLGSAWLCYALPLTALGQVFVIGQALAVLLLAELEYTGWRRLSAARQWPDE